MKTYGWAMRQSEQLYLKPISRGVRVGEQVLQPSSRAMSITQAPSTRPTSCGSTTFDSATPGAGTFGGHSTPTQQHVVSTEPAILWFSQPLHHTPPEVTSVILQARQCIMFQSKAFFHPGSVLFSSPLAGDHTDEGQRGTGIGAEESRLIRNSGAQPMGQSVMAVFKVLRDCSGQWEQFSFSGLSFAHLPAGNDNVHH